MKDIIWNYVHLIGAILAAWGVVWYFGWPWWSGLPLWFAIHTVAVMMSERQRKENEAFSTAVVEQAVRQSVMSRTAGLRRRSSMNAASLRQVKTEHKD